jgi:hypothetical protein
MNWPDNNTGSLGGFRPQIKKEVNVVTSVRCSKCQRAGHLARYCRSKPTFGTCRRDGHASQDCRARDSQEKRAIGYPEQPRTTRSSGCVCADRWDAFDHSGADETTDNKVNSQRSWGLDREDSPAGGSKTDHVALDLGEFT